MTKTTTKQSNSVRSETLLPWATDAKLVKSEETDQMLCDLNDDNTRSEWLAWGKENEAI